jgi:hypothetical protein
MEWCHCSFPQNCFSLGQSIIILTTEQTVAINAVLQFCHIGNTSNGMDVGRYGLKKKAAR